VGVSLTQAGKPEQQEVTVRVTRRILVRAIITVLVVAGMIWLSGFQPFYASMLRLATVPLALLLLWWTWRAMRTGRDRRAADRRLRARREEHPPA
jgi:hypothetical protein